MATMNWQQVPNMERNADRNLLREQEKARRAQAAKAAQQKDSLNTRDSYHLFGAPVKITRNNEQIERVLGAFDDISSFITHSSSSGAQLLGVSNEPITPLSTTPGTNPFAFPAKHTKNEREKIRDRDKEKEARQQTKAPSPLKSPLKSAKQDDRKNLFDQFGKPKLGSSAGPDERHSESKVWSQREYEHNKHRQKKSHRRESRERHSSSSSSRDGREHSSSSGHSTRHSVESHRDRERDRAAASHGSQQRGSSHSKRSASSSPSKSVAPPTSSNPPPRTSSTDVFLSPPAYKQVSKKTESSSSSSAKPFPKPNGVLNGSIKRDRDPGKDKMAPKNKHLRINVPEKNHNQPGLVEKIIKEMDFDEIPLTAIQTPRKEEAPRFPLLSSVKEEATKQLFSKSKEKESTNSQDKNRSKPSDKVVQLLKDDLDVSSDSEDEKAFTPTVKKSVSLPQTKRSPKKSLSSEKADSVDKGGGWVSSSSGSESSSGSDSDSSSSDNEEEQQAKQETEPPQPSAAASPPKPSWSLSKWLPGTQPGLSAAEADPVSVARPDPVSDMDKSNEALCEDLIDKVIFQQEVPNVFSDMDISNIHDIDSIENMMNDEEEQEEEAEEEEEEEEKRDKLKLNGAQEKTPVAYIARKGIDDAGKKSDAESSSDSEDEEKGDKSEEEDDSDEDEEEDGNCSISPVKFQGDNGLRLKISLGKPAGLAAMEAENKQKEVVVPPSGMKFSSDVKSPGASSVKSNGSGRSSTGKSPSRPRGRPPKAASKSPAVDKNKHRENSQSKTKGGTQKLSKSTNPKSVSSPKTTKTPPRSVSSPKTKTPPRSSGQQNQGKTPPKGGRKRNRSPKSAEIVNISFSSSSDEDEMLNVDIDSLIPLKVNGDLKPQSPSHQKPKSKNAKPKDNNNQSKPLKRQSSSSKLRDMISSVIGSGSLTDEPEPLLSPIPSMDRSSDVSMQVSATSPAPALSSPHLKPSSQPTKSHKSLASSSISSCAMSSTTAAKAAGLPSGLTYVKGKPSVMVQLDLVLIDRLPKPPRAVETTIEKVIAGDLDHSPMPLHSPAPPIAPICDTAPVLGSSPPRVEKADSELSDGECSSSDSEPETEPPRPKDSEKPIKEEPATPSQSQTTPTHSQATPTHSQEAKYDKYNPNEVLSHIFKTEDKVSVSKMKIPKRKPDSPGVREDHKRPKLNHKPSPRPTAKDKQHEKSSHEDDRKWDRKHPSRSDTASSPRYSRQVAGGPPSTNSSSSQHSDTRDRSSGSRDRHADSQDRRTDRRRDTDSKSTSDRGKSTPTRGGTTPDRGKATPDRGKAAPGGGSVTPDRGKTTTDRAPEKSERREKAERVADKNKAMAERMDVDKKKGEKSAENTDGILTPSHWSSSGSIHSKAAVTKLTKYSRDTHDSIESPDWYLAEAKRLKHIADDLVDRLAKSMAYVEAVLSFLLCGYAMEHDKVTVPQKIYTMYRDTFHLLRHICKFRGNHEADTHEKEKKLSVLSLKIQSLLCLKLFKLKKNEAANLKRAIDDHHNKSGGSKSVPAPSPSPYQNNWNRSTGTPSPMSPQPSPAGSVGSVSSVGSGNGDYRIPNGNMGAASSSSSMTNPSTISVPQRIHSITHEYLNHMNYLYQCHDLWEQADQQAAESTEFFKELEVQCGGLSLHSSVTDLVQYVRLGLMRLKDT